MLAKLAGIPEEVIENIDVKIPSQPSVEFKELMLKIAKKASKEGIIGQEKFEYNTDNAENYMNAVVALALAVALALVVWLALWVV